MSALSRVVGLWRGLRDRGHVLVYVDKPETIDALEVIIRGVIADMGRMFQNVVENWASRESVQQNPRQSILRRSQEVGLTTWRILRRHLSLHPYKIQELKPNAHTERLVFADLVLELLEVDPNFGRKIIISDEAHF